MSKYDIISSQVLVYRKPFGPDETPKTKLDDISKKVQKLIKELPIIDGNNLNFGDGGSGFFEYFLNGNQQFYQVKIGERLFFVDTQGYDYARYVGEIIN